MKALSRIPRAAFAMVLLVATVTFAMMFDGPSGFLWRIPEETVSANGIGFIEYPSYRPDGLEVVFETGWHGPREIWAVSTVDGRLRPIADPVSGRAYVGVHPAWSPNGKWIAFARGGIRLVRPDGSGLTQLTRGSGSDREPAWSPDGTRIVFSSIADMRSGRSDIWMINTNGSGLRQLTKPPPRPQESGRGYGYHPAFSPDGSEIVFSQGGSPRAIGPGCGGNKLVIINVDGTGARQITTRDNLGFQYPSWSKRGILAVASRCGSPDEIMVIQPDGANLQAIPKATGKQPRWSPWQPTWSPDSTKVAFVRADADEINFTVFGVYEFDFYSGTTRALVQLKGDFIAIDIMPGTSSKAVSLKDTTLIRVAVPFQVQSGYNPTQLGFDLQQIDRSSITFGRTGDEHSLAYCADDSVGLMCHFKTALTGFQPGDTQGILRLLTVNQTNHRSRFEGRGTIQIAP